MEVPGSPFDGLLWIEAICARIDDGCDVSTLDGPSLQQAAHLVFPFYRPKQKQPPRHQAVANPQRRRSGRRERSRIRPSTLSPSTRPSTTVS